MKMKDLKRDLKPYKGSLQTTSRTIKVGNNLTSNWFARSAPTIRVKNRNGKQHKGPP